jgi:predicted nucleic acid-binding protein
VIFVDTSFWIGWRSRRDAHHSTAVSLMDAYAGEEDLVTTNHVCGEAWTFLRRRLGHASAVDLIDRIEASPRVSVRTVSETLEEQAWAWLRQHDEREYSFVDATSFATMRSLRLRRAFAFDGDFAAAGFDELRI